MALFGGVFASLFCIGLIFGATSALVGIRGALVGDLVGEQSLFSWVLTEADGFVDSLSLSFSASPTRSTQGSTLGSTPKRPLASPPGHASPESPPALPPELLSGRPLQGLLIALDPGHGGIDRGVCHFPDELIEKEINLDMATRLKAVLETAGAQVLLTRAEDASLSLDERAEAANRAGAHLFLSLHVNRIPGHPECFGAQTFYFPGSADGERLATIIQEELIKADPENYRNPLPGSYRVLRLTTMPGALVEIGFMTNERDRQLMATDD